MKIFLRCGGGGSKGEGVFLEWGANGGRGEKEGDRVRIWGDELEQRKVRN